MTELVNNRALAIERRKQVEEECMQLKQRMLKDMTDYKKWKAAVLVDLRSRIDRVSSLCCDLLRALRKAFPKLFFAPERIESDEL